MVIRTVYLFTAGYIRMSFIRFATHLNGDSLNRQTPIAISFVKVGRKNRQRVIIKTMTVVMTHDDDDDHEIYRL